MDNQDREDTNILKKIDKCIDVNKDRQPRPNILKKDRIIDINKDREDRWDTHLKR